MPSPGSPLTVTYKSVMPFAEFIIRKMVVAHVSQKLIVLRNCMHLVYKGIHRTEHPVVYEYVGRGAVHP